MVATLMAHCGARLVTPGELDLMDAPPPTDTWFPIRHSQVLDTVMGTLDKAGFGISRVQLAVSADSARFFGTLDLSSPVCEGVNLAVGIRNSVDKSFPIAFCCGERVFVCDNLAFSSEIVVSKKHTRFGGVRFTEGIARAVVGLRQYQTAAAERIERFQKAVLSVDQANSVILQAYERGILGARVLPRVIHEWRHPCHDEFRERTAWSLLNCITEVLKERQRERPAEAAYQTITLQKLLSERGESCGVEQASA